MAIKIFPKGVEEMKIKNIILTFIYILCLSASLNLFLIQSAKAFSIGGHHIPHTGGGSSGGGSSSGGGGNSSPSAPSCGFSCLLGKIGSNASSIATNAENIGTNTTDIGNIMSTLGDLLTDVENILTDVQTIVNCGLNFSSNGTYNGSACFGNFAYSLINQTLSLSSDLLNDGVSFIQGYATDIETFTKNAAANADSTFKNAPTTGELPSAAKTALKNLANLKDDNGNPLGNDGPNMSQLFNSSEKWTAAKQAQFSSMVPMMFPAAATIPSQCTDPEQLKNLPTDQIITCTNAIRNSFTMQACQQVFIEIGNIKTAGGDLLADKACDPLATGSSGNNLFSSLSPIQSFKCAATAVHASALAVMDSFKLGHSVLMCGIGMAVKISNQLDFFFSQGIQSINQIGGSAPRT